MKNKDIIGSFNSLGNKVEALKNKLIADGFISTNSTTVVEYYGIHEIVRVSIRIDCAYLTVVSRENEKRNFEIDLPFYPKHDFSLIFKNIKFIKDKISNE